VESEPGVGTMSTIYLPASESETPEEEGEVRSLSHKGRVSVIDDEEVIRMLLMDMLSH
jgi:hypothetical protein